MWLGKALENFSLNDVISFSNKSWAFINFGIFLERLQLFPLYLLNHFLGKLTLQFDFKNASVILVFILIFI
jgi:hypothetical protein